MSDTPKKRGRPPMPPELKAQVLEERRIKKNAYKKAYDKANGYSSQKKYKAAHPEVYRGRHYEPKLRIPLGRKDTLAQLMAQTGLTITQLFVGAVEEKYGVILHDDVDNPEEL